MDIFRNKYRISSARLRNWDYGWNASYFVTICTANRECFFGKIENDTMIFSEIGTLANKYWLEIPNHFPFIQLDVHVVMPNHVHGIIVIEKPNGGQNDLKNNKGILARNVETPNLDNVATPNLDNVETPNLDNVETPNLDNVETPNLGVSNPYRQTDAASEKWKSESLGVIINQYKRICTINARKIHTDFAWQSRFHDHIIRNDGSYQRIRNYIINNPKKWNNDTMNKSAF